MESTDAPARRRFPAPALAGSLVGIALLSQAGIVRRFGVNVPIWDEFFYVPFVYLVRTGRNWTSWIFLQHNEHRMVAMKLALAPLSALTAWNVVAEMYFSVILVAISLWGLGGIFRRVTERSLLAFAPLAFLLCSPAQYFNMLTGIQMAFYFTLLGTIWSFRMLIKDSVPRTLGACAFAALASFSTINGFLVWPIGLVQLVASRAGRKRLGIWLIAGGACAALYFLRYSTPSQIAAINARTVLPESRLSFFVAALGAPLAAGSSAWAIAAGILILLLVYLGVCEEIMQGGVLTPQRAPAYSLVLAGVLFAASIAYGRAAFGRSQALESRYITFSQLAIAGVYMLALSGRSARVLGRIVPALVCIGLAAALVHGIGQARWWRSEQEQKRALLLGYASEPDSVLRKLYFPGDLRRYARYLRNNRLSAFHDVGGTRPR